MSGGTSPVPQPVATAVPQQVAAPLATHAIFLIMTVGPDTGAEVTVRGLCADLSALTRAVETRDTRAELTCVMGIGSTGWDRLFGVPRPAELHPFREFGPPARCAPATAGDLLFHIRANRFDMCFDLARLITGRLANAASTVDEVHGFRYFDGRSMVGFVDGTENPRGKEAADATLIGAEDPKFAGGSYVIAQKYLHDMDGWNALPIETQERIIGRTKLDNVELDDSVKPTFAHNALTVIEENGAEQAILRDNMPFGRPGQGEFGTFFIGYCKTPRITELMLENMFVGRPPGNYDRLLDFSKAVTGGLFFVPPATFLDGVSAVSEGAGNATPGLGIGSLKAEPRDE